MRRARRLTQEQLAERAGLTPKYVSEIENGHANPSVKVLFAIATDGLEITLPELLGGLVGRPLNRPAVARILELLEDEPEDVCIVVSRVVEAVVRPLADLPSARRT